MLIENLILFKINLIIFFRSYVLVWWGFCFWVLILSFNFFNIFLTWIVLILIISFRVFLTLLIGLFRKSKYSFIGSIRFCNQSISFEIVLFCLFFVFILIIKNILFYFHWSFFVFILTVLLLLLFLVELNRTPFDFSEGERELVGGWITEVGRINFILIFITEYNMILFFRYFCSLFLFNWILFTFLSLIILFRCSFPRFRYDLLIRLFWFEILVYILILLILFGVI